MFNLMSDAPRTAVVILALAVAFALWACSSAHGPKPEPTVERMSNILERNLNLFPSARDYDAPGTVIGTDGQGTWHLISSRPAKALAESNMVERGEERFPKMRFEGSTTTGLTLGLLSGSPTIPAQANAEAKYQRTLNLIIDVGNATRERVAEDDLRDAVWDVVDIIDWEREDWQYFVISETVLSDSVGFILNNNSLSNLGGKAEIDQLVQANSALSYARESATEVELRMRFSKPLRVLYKVRALTPLGVGLPGEKPDSLAFPIVNRPIINVFGEAPREEGTN